jgi:hypothetical protein
MPLFFLIRRQKVTTSLLEVMMKVYLQEIFKASMTTKTKNLCRFPVIVTLLFTLSSCQDQSGRAGKRPSIKDFTIGTDVTTDNSCSDFVSSDFQSCLTSCPDGFHEADEDEINGLIGGLQDSLALTDDEVAELAEVALGAKGVCTPDILRPDKAVKLKSDHCACLNDKAIVLNNCASFCVGRNTTDVEQWFVNVTLQPEIALNPDMGSLKNWCTVEIADGNTNPSCVVEFFDGVGFRTEPLVNFTGNSSFTLDIKNLPKDVTFTARIVELTSGASSDFIQLRKFEPTTATQTITGPLKIHPASMYTCITRAGQAVSGGFNFNQALRLHFFFSPNNPPPSLPPLGTGQVYCHDIEEFGINDSPLYPRLELIPEHFAVWDFRDPRFVDTNGNSKEDINDQLQTRLAVEYGINREVKIFGVLRWPNVIPTTSSSGSSSTSTQAPIMGYFMQPWVNPTSGTGFCPGQAHYNGTDPMFRVMKETVGVDTEGIYLSLREPLVITNPDGSFSPAPDDVMIIRENLLKKIWFYYENGKHFVPDDFSASNKTIMFYWPPDINNPYTQKSNQYIYIVRSPDSIGSSTTSTDLQTSIRPPDKRFGCVPSLGVAK